MNVFHQKNALKRSPLCISCRIEACINTKYELRHDQHVINDEMAAFSFLKDKTGRLDHKRVSQSIYFLQFLNQDITFSVYNDLAISIRSTSSSFCVTQANLLGSHTLILTGYFLVKTLNARLNHGILSLLFCTLSTFF